MKWFDVARDGRVDDVLYASVVKDRAWLPLHVSLRLVTCGSEGCKATTLGLCADGLARLGVAIYLAPLLVTVRGKVKAPDPLVLHPSMTPPDALVVAPEVALAEEDARAIGAFRNNAHLDYSAVGLFSRKPGAMNCARFVETLMYKYVRCSRELGFLPATCRRV